ncbi:MAG: LPS export ABC transporter periplasmic protein LptC [Candidatus Acidiferrales bacterium]
MRRTEAARYARWSAMMALLLALVVTSVYVRRAWRRSAAQRNAPAVVPVTVQQQSAQFSFSKVEGNRTLFTVRASQATQYKDANRNLLDDVWITVYGRDGARHDDIHTRECDYDSGAGRIVCQGDVQIDLESAADWDRGASEKVIHLATKNILFDNRTGHATTPAPVQIKFQNGECNGIGLEYNSSQASVTLERGVTLNIHSQSRPAAPPVLLSGTRLEYRRDARLLQLAGPAQAQQGTQTLRAGAMFLDLDAAMRARRVRATGNPEMESSGPNESIRISASEFSAELNPAGWVENFSAAGSVRGERKGSGGFDEFHVESAEIEMAPQLNQPRKLKATGGVLLNSQMPGGSRTLQTNSLELQFAANAEGRGSHIVSGETLASGTIESRAGDEKTHAEAKHFQGQFDGQGRLERLLGHGGVSVVRQLRRAAPQTTSAQELTMKLGSGGDWSQVEESGDVRFRQTDRSARADRARMSRSDNSIELEGSPVIADAESSTQAQRIEINQSSGDVHAAGGVRTTYLSSPNNRGPNLGNGPAHIVAERLDGNSQTGHALYSGNARMWQGDSVVEGDAIEIWRPEQWLEARGAVRAVFPQAPDAQKPGGGPTLWNIHAAKLDYYDQANRASLDGGVTAETTGQSILAQKMQLLLSSPAGAKKQLDTAVAQGQVVVRQGGRRGTGERADYSAVDEKFVLSGGTPTIIDAAGNTTQGRSLTFFRASDTIFVDSPQGMRTLTEHRIEK